jgi:hypothetical protein
LDGVSDEWIKSIHVEQVAGGQLPANLDAQFLAQATQEARSVRTCCDLAKN